MSSFNTEFYSVRVLRDKKTNQIKSEYWEVDGCLHKIGYPAEVDFNLETGEVNSYAFWFRGSLHREGGPARVVSDPESGKVILKRYHHYGLLTREGDLPAEISIDPHTDVVKFERYWIDGSEHRVGKPSCIERDPKSGNTIYLEWKEDHEYQCTGDRGSVQRIDRHSGVVVEEEFLRSEAPGERHRLEGPAYIRRDPKSGEVVEVKYFVDDQEIPVPNKESNLDFD